MICMHNCTDCKRKLSITARDRGPQHGRRSRFVRPNLASEPGMQRVHVGITPTSSSSCRHHHSNSHLRCRSLGPLDWANARSGPCSLADLGVPPHLLMGVPSPRCTHAQGYRYLFYCVIIRIRIFVVVRWAHWIGPTRAAGGAVWPNSACLLAISNGSASSQVHPCPGLPLSLFIIIIITQRADCDGACGWICAAGGRRPCRAEATSAELPT